MEEVVNNSSWSPVRQMEDRALELAGLTRDEAFEIDKFKMMVNCAFPCLIDDIRHPTTDIVILTALNCLLRPHRSS